ncbi:MAG: pyridoxal-dependent decarboxylase [Pseudomonadota bacterium]
MQKNRHEINLDPEDWEGARRNAHELLDVLFDRLKDVGDRPAWQPLPEEIRDSFREPVPRQGQTLDAVCDRLRDAVIPYPTGNISPRFYGWVMGNGTIDGMIADMVAAGMNSHLAGYDQSASEIEDQTIAWCCEIMGYPTTAGGLFVSGGTMANVIGLIVARNAADPERVRHQGLSGLPAFRIYGSSVTHSWAEKGCDIIGMGRDSMVRVAADDQHRVDLSALAEAVADDRKAGKMPLAVVANVGTVDSGAIDDLHALADFCEREKLWLHVDGAFGALLAFSTKLKHLTDGMARADSIAFDLHKWGFLQYEIGAVLVRDRALQEQAFATQAAYLTPPGRGIQPQDLHFAAMGPQLSRGFRALKAWVAFQHHGIDKIGAIVAQNVEQAQHLAQRVRQHEQLELFEPAPLNIVCFRYVADGVDDETLDGWNREILLRIQESGLAVPSSTRRDGCFVIRVAITNHRSTVSDMDLLLDAVVEHGDDVRATAS